MRADEDLEELEGQEEEEDLDQAMAELHEEAPLVAEEEADEKEEIPEAIASYADVISAMHLILDGQEVDVELLEALSEEEREALDLLAKVVAGRSERGAVFYAEYRLEALNHILAVLQPAMSVAVSIGPEDLHASFQEVVDQLDEFRHQLDQLDGAEEEYMFQEEEAKATAPDQDDQDDALGEVGEQPRPSFLAGKPGEPAVEKPVVPTTLVGKPNEPAVEKPVVPTTLVGKPNEPAVEKPVQKSTLE